MPHHQIVKMKFGSHLYGTSTPASDTDYKGVALPTAREVLLGKVPKHIENSTTGAAFSRNTSEDVDIEIFSLHQFIKLGLEGQTVVMDMIHAPLHMCEEYDALWVHITKNKHKFYSNNVGAFLGYVMKQTAKYGQRGSRLNDVKLVLDWLGTKNSDYKLADCNRDNFPVGENIKFVDDGIKIPYYDICGKKVQITNTVGYVIPIFEKFYKNYGQRTMDAANNLNVDWKAVSHAFRAAYQIKELLTEGNITFPRPEAKFLVQVKTGVLDFKELSPLLDDLVDEVKELRDKSTLPDKPDVKFWEEFIMEVMLHHVL